MHGHVPVRPRQGWTLAAAFIRHVKYVPFLSCRSFTMHCSGSEPGLSSYTHSSFLSDNHPDVISSSCQHLAAVARGENEHLWMVTDRDKSNLLSVQSPFLYPRTTFQSLRILEADPMTNSPCGPLVPTFPEFGSRDSSVEEERQEFFVSSSNLGDAFLSLRKKWRVVSLRLRIRLIRTMNQISEYKVWVKGCSARDCVFEKKKSKCRQEQDQCSLHCYGGWFYALRYI